jgi:deoxycytidine triphosphate deaminase
MSIKSDKWIRHMAQEYGMIEPFEPNQIRETDGQKVISYGTSSYGYDIRCADEFKLFTNIYSAIVDPKNFNPQSFVDVKGNYVIIPPNSFALARTIEYFRIPRNVMTICLGKSTYARCFRGDTRVALVDGSAPTLEEMARRADKGELFYGYSIDASGHLAVMQLEAPRFIGRDALVEVALDNRQLIYCTPDHQFIRNDGRMTVANDLRPGDPLMSLRRNWVRRHETIHRPLYASLDLSFDLINKQHPSLKARTMTSGLPVRGSEVALGIVTGWKIIPEFTTGKVVRMLSGKPQLRSYRVSSVRELAGDHDVYCLTVPGAGNFALEAGVFVHNCGIIVNVTPFEPEWEGYVTLEFSNTTPMPAKIYANEGVAQVIFFEADEICEVSYKDRGGKYQRQQGVTPPKL